MRPKPDGYRFLGFASRDHGQQVIDDKGSFAAGNEARTRDLNLGKIAPQTVQIFDL